MTRFSGWRTVDAPIRCRPCRRGEHLLCDGGTCECECAAELDKPIKIKPLQSIEWHKLEKAVVN